MRASEVAEKLRIVYVYCNDCKQHLCKKCDFNVHVSPLEDSDTDQEDQDLKRSVLSSDGLPQVYQSKIK